VLWRDNNTLAIPLAIDLVADRRRDPDRAGRGTPL